MGNKSPRANNGAAGHVPEPEVPSTPRCNGDFHVNGDIEMECHNKHCCHGKDGGKIIVCTACGKRNMANKRRWLCRLCFLAEQNDETDNDAMEIDTEKREFSRTGVRLNEE